MSSYEQWFEEAPIEFKKRLVAEFVSFTLGYAEDKIQKYDSTQEAKKLAKWRAYEEFQRYTLEELGTDELDHVFER